MQPEHVARRGDTAELKFVRRLRLKQRQPVDGRAVAAKQVAEEEAAMWEAEGAGFLRLDFDAVTQRRRRVATNEAASWQFGMRREEALARFAVGDIALPYTDMDVLRYFVAELGEVSPTKLLSCALNVA